MAHPGYKLGAHPRWIGGTSPRVVTRRASRRLTIGAIGTIGRIGTVATALHAAIDEPPAACALRAETLPRRKFGATVILSPRLRIARREGDQAHRDDGGGSDGGGNDGGAHGFSPLHCVMRSSAATVTLAIERRVTRVVRWYSRSPGSIVARVERSETRGNAIQAFRNPGYASLHPGYTTQPASDYATLHAGDIA